MSGVSVWSKDLATRDELPVTKLSTDVTPPCVECAGRTSVSGDWVVWSDIRGGQRDIFARELPNGAEVQVTDDRASQFHPHIDGTTVVWLDDRDEGSFGSNIYKKDLLSGTEEAVTTAPGPQLDPVVSGNTIVWTDLRTGNWDLWAKVGSGPEFRLFQSPSGSSSHSPSISGNRVVWQLDSWPFGSPMSNKVKTCVVAADCSATDVETTTDLQQEPDISGTTAVWQQRAFATSTVHVRVKDLTGGSSSQVDASTGTAEMAATDGTTIVWREISSPNSNDLADIYYRSVNLSSPPSRANSVSMGMFGDHSKPAATGPHVLYDFPNAPRLHMPFAYLDTSSGKNRVARTLLADSSSTDLAVSSFEGQGTGPPRVSGTKAVWRDFRNCPDLSCSGDIFEKDPFTGLPGSETAIPLGSGESALDPDADGPRTAWRCKAKAICVRSAGTTNVFDLSPYLMGVPVAVDEIVRISGDVVVWAERTTTLPGDEAMSRIHALKAVTGSPSDNILGSGDWGFVSSFDVDGLRVVWTRGTFLDVPTPPSVFQNTVQFPCSGDSCDRSGSTSILFTGPVGDSLFLPSVEGSWTAWVARQSSFPFEQDIHVKNGSGPVRLVTPGPSLANFPYIDSSTSRVYWEDRSNENADVFMASLDGSPLPAQDTTPPGPVSTVTATPSNGTPSSGSVTLDWSNPPDADLAGVRILRKSGSVPPAWLDDPSATIVYDGTGESFVDTDVVNGVQYSYAIYTYDQWPNYSSGVFVPNPPPLAIEYMPLEPGRVLDTRPSSQTGTCTPSPCSTLGAGEKIDLQITGEEGVSASGVSAVALNVTAVQPTHVGFLTVYPKGPPPNDPPLASNLNFTPGQIVPNFVQVKVGIGGKVSIYNGSSGIVDVVIDVAGWYSDGASDPPDGGRLQALAPSRVLDTRSSSVTGTCTPSPCAVLDPGEKIDVQITGEGRVPLSGVGAVVLNVTVTEPTAEGFLTVYPKGTPPNDPPLASNLNFTPGQTVPNLAITKVGSGGQVTIFNGASGETQVIFDVAGWFSAPGASVLGGSFGALSPHRILDTRPDPSNEGGFLTLDPGESIAIQVAGRGGIPVYGVSAAVINVTVTGPTSSGFLTLYPDGESQPLSSNLNFTPGLTVPNLVMVKVGRFGRVRILNGSPGAVEVIVDVAGWYTNTN